MRSSRSQAGWVGSPSTVSLRPVSGGGQGGGSTTRRAALNTGGSTTHRGASSARALLAASLLLLLVLLVAGLPSASASLYANGAGYSLNSALLLPGVSIGGLDVGPTLHRLLAAMRDAELRLDAQQRRIDGLQADNGGLRANLTLAVERVRQLEALNGNTTDIFAGIVRDSMRLQSSAEQLNATVGVLETQLTALQGSNATLFGSVTSLLAADLLLSAGLRSTNASLIAGLALLSAQSAVPPPLYVGLAGSGAASEFAVGCSNYNSGHASAVYWLDRGVVYLQGIITMSGATGTGIPLFTLPPGYRPQRRQGYAVSAYVAFGLLIIDPNGVVSLAAAPTDNGLGITLDGIAFNKAAA